MLEAIFEKVENMLGKKIPDSVKKPVTQMKEKASQVVKDLSVRSDINSLFSTLEDFHRVDPVLKRLVVIGCTGSGKSTLLNVMGGWQYTQREENDWAWKWEGLQDDPNATPIFEAVSSAEAVTKKSSFANVHWFGDKTKPFVVVDTPGHDDPEGADIEDEKSRERLGELAADLHNKLKALGRVDAILVIHNDVHSNRLNPATYTILKMIDEKFAKVDVNVWSRVIIAYSKCNEQSTDWRSQLTKKRDDLRAAIHDKIPRSKDIHIPVINLGGGVVAGKDKKEPTTPSDFQVLHDFLTDNKATPLNTEKLQPFEGAEVKWQKVLDDKDRAEAQAKAAIIYMAVSFKIAVLLAMLFSRSFVLPGFLSVLLLNLEVFGILDELLIIGIFVKWIGPQNTFYSLCTLHEIWVKPQVDKLVASFKDAQGTAKDKKE